MSGERDHRLCVAVVLDGRPGHEKQTTGIVQAMQTMARVDTVQLKVGPDNPLRLLWRTLLLFMPIKAPAPPLPNAAGIDLLLGTGSSTHLPLLELKKQYGIPAVTCMKPPLHLRRRFDLCCVPEHDGIREQGNIMLTSGSPNRSINSGRHRSDHGLILLGGIDEKSHRWDSARICATVTRLIEAEKKTSWTISSSPRTPADTVALLEKFAQASDNAIFVRYQDTPPGWIENQYDKSGKVWVTADSISMMYEALTAGCRVGILPVEWKRADSKFKKNEELLVQRNLAVPFAAWQAGDCRWRDDINLNEAHRCAERILRTWFPESLP